MNLLLWGAETWSLRKSQLDKLKVFLHQSIQRILQILMTKVQEQRLRNGKVCDMEITNFIRNNRDDWDKFCTKTAHAMRNAKKAPNLSKQPSKHKIVKNKGLLAPELLLQENPHCFILFPIHHADIWRMYKKAKASFWMAEEIDLSADPTDWVRQSNTKHHFISHVLAFFAASDGIVNENLSSSFTTKVMGPQSLVLLWLPDRSREHLQKNVLPPH